MGAGFLKTNKTIDLFIQIVLVTSAGFAFGGIIYAVKDTIDTERMRKQVKK